MLNCCCRCSLVPKPSDLRSPFLYLMAPWRTIPVHSNVRISHRFCCSCALCMISVQVLDSCPYKWLRELLLH
jgi:hypothetical protein